MTGMQIIIRQAKAEEYKPLGELLVQVYAALEGFPRPDEQPEYYDLLRNIGAFASRPETELLVAVTEDGLLTGGVVYFADMQYYGSGGIATEEKNAAGFRLLAVAPRFQGKGIGKILTRACIQKARETGKGQLIIHSTDAMQTAWKMYEDLGFKRSADLDFLQSGFPVYGFRLQLGEAYPG